MNGCVVWVGDFGQIPASESLPIAWCLITILYEISDMILLVDTTSLRFRKARGAMENLN